MRQKKTKPFYGFACCGSPIRRSGSISVIEAFNLLSMCLDGLLDIDNPYFEGMLNQIYPPELQLNKSKTTDTAVPYLIYIISLLMGLVHLIFDKRDDFFWYRKVFVFEW